MPDRVEESAFVKKLSRTDILQDSNLAVEKELPESKVAESKVGLGGIMISQTNGGRLGQDLGQGGFLGLGQRQGQGQRIGQRGFQQQTSQGGFGRGSGLLRQGGRGGGGREDFRNILSVNPDFRSDAIKNSGIGGGRREDFRSDAIKYQIIKLFTDCKRFTRDEDYEKLAIVEEGLQDLLEKLTFREL